MMTQVFRGRTLADAQRAAEAALGPDPIIVTTRKVPRGGIGGLLGSTDVEISAEPARRALPEPTADAARTIASPPSPFAEAARRPVGRASAGDDLAQLRTELRGEIRAMRTIIGRDPGARAGDASEIAELRAAIERLAPEPTPRGRIARLLRARGIEGPAADELTRALRGAKLTGDNENEVLRDALADLIKVAPWPLGIQAETTETRAPLESHAREARAVLALLGPSGVGKTTTVAKLAARAVLEQGRSMTLVCCDAFRVGAAEQLQRFASLLDANYEVAHSPADLIRIVTSARTDLVFVDTAGRAPAGGDDIEASLAALTKGKVRGAPAAEVLLCLPASVRAPDAARFARAFGRSAPTALAITKIDETDTPAGLCHASVAAKLPVAVLCFGQRVPEDIAPATTGAILDHLAPPRAARRRAS